MVRDFNFIVSTLKYNMPHLKMLKGQHVLVRVDSKGDIMYRHENIYTLNHQIFITIYVCNEFIPIKFYQINN
jgi:hypothetical protein